MCHFSKAHARTFDVLPKKNEILSQDLRKKGEQSRTPYVVKTKAIVTSLRLRDRCSRRHFVDAKNNTRGLPWLLLKDLPYVLKTTNETYVYISSLSWFFEQMYGKAAHHSILDRVLL